MYTSFLIDRYPKFYQNRQLLSFNSIGSTVSPHRISSRLLVYISLLIGQLIENSYSYNRSSYSNSVQGAKGLRLTRTADFSLTNQSKLNRWIEVEKKLHLSSYLHSNSWHSRKLRYKFSTKRNRDSIDRMIFPFVRMNVEKTVPVSSLLEIRRSLCKQGEYDWCARNAKANEIPRDLTIDRKSFNGE